MTDPVLWRTATASAESNCVQVGWAKSTASSSGQCVETAVGGDAVRVRDSKDPDGPRLAFTPDAWAAFLRGARGGEFD